MMFSTADLPFSLKNTIKHYVSAFETDDSLILQWYIPKGGKGLLTPCPALRDFFIMIRIHLPLQKFGVSFYRCEVSAVMQSLLCHQLTAMKLSSMLKKKDQRTTEITAVIGPASCLPRTATLPVPGASGRQSGPGVASWNWLPWLQL